MDEHAYDAKANETALASQSNCLMTQDGLLAINAGNRVSHSFTGAPLAIWRRIAVACGPDCLDYDDAKNKELALVDYYCHEVQLANDQTGNIDTCIRVVLFDAEGFAYAFVSKGIYDSLRSLVMVMGRGTFNPPVKVRIVESKTRSKRTFYSIVPVA
jgi:Phage Single-stranded DNA-binding protein